VAPARLNARIAARVAVMRDAGLVDEVRGLRDRGELSRTAAQAIGYREVLDHLDGKNGLGGNTGLNAALEATVVRTRQFARRQRMWFRRDPRISWFGATGNACTILPALLASWSA
jgi:tRNA dimethylallyltransferase